MTASLALAECAVARLARCALLLLGIAVFGCGGDAAAAAAEGTEHATRGAADSRTRPAQLGDDAAVSATAPSPRDETPSPMASAGRGGASSAARDGGTTSPREPAADGGARVPMTANDCDAWADTDGMRSLQVGSTTREYLLHVPKAAGVAPRPLLVDLHGLLTHAAFERATSGFLQLADAKGFVVAYPNALDGAWNSGACCTPDPGVDDVAFMRAMIAALAANSCIDARRVYVAGRSDGGGLAQRLACEAADVVAAVLSQDFDFLTESVADCKPMRPIAVLAIRSAADAQLPYDGGEIRPLNGLNAKIHALGAVDSLQRWAALSQCGGTPQSRDPECQFHSGCGAAVEVGLCTRAGKRTTAADAAAGWEFLSRFSLP